MSSAYSFLECKLINVGGTIGLENRHFAILSIIIDSGKDHQQMLRLLGERLLGNRIFTYSQVVTLSYVTVTMGKCVFTMAGPCSHCLWPRDQTSCLRLWVPNWDVRQTCAPHGRQEQVRNTTRGYSCQTCFILL